MSTNQLTPTAGALPARSAKTLSFLERLGAIPVLMVGTFMVVLDFFIVSSRCRPSNVSLTPAAARSSGLWPDAVARSPSR
jgi:hypothetical protein